MPSIFHATRQAFTNDDHYLHDRGYRPSCGGVQLWQECASWNDYCGSDFYYDFISAFPSDLFNVTIYLIFLIE